MLVWHRKQLCTWLNKVMLCFCFGGSHQSLKVHEVKCIPGDPAITCPVLFKGPTPRCHWLCFYVAYCTLRPYLIRRYLVFCWLCCVMLVGTALYIHLLVYAGLSLFIISGLYVYMVVCVVYAYNLTLSVEGEEFLHLDTVHKSLSYHCWQRAFLPKPVPSTWGEF